MMEYGFIIVVVVGGMLLRGAKAIIDAINKKKQPGSGPGSAMPAQRVPPAASDRSTSRPTPVARPLPPRIRKSGQTPVARPLPSRPSAPRQVPAPPMRSPDEIVIPELVRELATPQARVPTRPPERSARGPAPSAPPRPRRKKGSKRKPETQESRTSEERLGHLEAFSHDKHLDPESHLHLKKKKAVRAGDGRKLGGMSSRAVLRQAIVMNEILGLPFALRQQDDPDPWGP